MQAKDFFTTDFIPDVKYPDPHRSYYVRRVKDNKITYAIGPCMKPTRWVHEKEKAALYPVDVVYLIINRYRELFGWEDDLAYRLGFDDSQGGRLI